MGRRQGMTIRTKKVEIFFLHIAVPTINMVHLDRNVAGELIYFTPATLRTLVAKLFPQVAY